MNREMVASTYKMAIHARARESRDGFFGLIHHNDRGSQYTSDDFASLLAAHGVRQYLTIPLLQEIKDRLKQIESNKDFFGKEYQDYGLLICQPDGYPLDPKSLCPIFKKAQRELKIENQIDFQGLRKSEQMHKVRLTKNDYQLVAENSGQSPEVLMNNYNEVLDSEKRQLAMMVENSFYPLAEQPQKLAEQESNDVSAIIQKIRENPELSQKILQLLFSNAVVAQ
jgi:hypothetical protein